MAGLPRPSFSELFFLKKLHFSCRCLEQLPGNFSMLPCLEELELMDCSYMKTLPTRFASLGALKKLRIVGTRRDSFLDPFIGLPSLEEVILSCGSSISSLPHALCQFSRLHTLTILKYDDLISLPANFGALVSLKRLVIRECRIFHHRPDSFSDLRSLVHLTVSHCPKFSTLPDGFGHLPQLTQLEITQCDSFTHLPACFPSLPLLRVACFSHCKGLHSLPPNMGQLPHLELLQVRQCGALKALPKSLKEAKSLRNVDVCGSKLDMERGEVEVCKKRVHVAG
ncbi:unnamed protein product [Closterium sp. NIES-54]